MTSTRAPLPTFVGPASGKKVEIPSPNTPRAAAVAARPAAHLAASSTRRRDAQIWVRSPAHASRRRSRRRSSRRVVERRVRSRWRGATHVLGRGGGRGQVQGRRRAQALQGGFLVRRDGARRVPRERARDLRAALDENTGGAARHWIANPRAAHDATLALGESLALAAAADVVASRVGPLTPQLVAAEADAKRRACLLYRDAAAALDDLAALGVASADQPERPDFETHQTAVVGAANALAAWGDLLDDPREAAPVLERAERRYETAANAELARLDRVDAGPASSAARSATFMSASADALAALWNLADARVKRGECAGRLGDAEAANALFDSAFRTYEAACGRAGFRRRGRPRRVTSRPGCGLVAAAQTLADAARAVKDTNDARSAALCAAAHHRARRRGGETSTRVRVLRRRLRSAQRVGRGGAVSRGTHASRASRRGARG